SERRSLCFFVSLCDTVSSVRSVSSYGRAPMIRTTFRAAAILVTAATLPALAQTSASQLVTVRHASGQAVAPVYEGFDVNADGTLNPVWQIDRRFTTRGGNSERISSNLPPVVELQSSAASLPAPGSLTLTVSATDDGLPKRRGESIGMTVMWAKYRGPGAVTF